jgi:hypothetical protein
MFGLIISSDRQNTKSEKKAPRYSSELLDQRFFINLNNITEED